MTARAASSSLPNCRVTSFAWADGLRRAHYPPERNRLKAHVTLFHAFAPSLRDELHGVLRRFAAEYAPPEAEIDRADEPGTWDGAGPSTAPAWWRSARRLPGTSTARSPRRIPMAPPAHHHPEQGVPGAARKRSRPSLDRPNAALSASPALACTSIATRPGRPCTTSPFAARASTVDRGLSCSYVAPLSRAIGAVQRGGVAQLVRAAES
jgi:hypothetical protein